MLQPELLCRAVAFHRRAVQCRHDIETQRVPDALQFGSELSVVLERVPERRQRNFQLAAGPVRTGPFHHQFQEFPLEIRAEACNRGLFGGLIGQGFRLARRLGARR